MAKYLYSRVHAGSLFVYKAFIPAILEYEPTHKISDPLRALLDTGADICVANLNVGYWLGINLTKIKPEVFRTANKSKLLGIKQTIRLHLQEAIYKTDMYFTDDLPGEVQIVLGNKGFFDHFKVTLNLPKKVFEVE